MEDWIVNGIAIGIGFVLAFTYCEYDAWKNEMEHDLRKGKTTHVKNRKI